DNAACRDSQPLALTVRTRSLRRSHPEPARDGGLFHESLTGSDVLVSSAAVTSTLCPVARSSRLSGGYLRVLNQFLSIVGGGRQRQSICSGQLSTTQHGGKRGGLLLPISDQSLQQLLFCSSRFHFVNHN